MIEKTLQDECLDIVNKAISNGRHLKFDSSGTSMMPFINTGDSILIEGSKPDRIRVGDVVLIKGNILHRVIRIQKNNGKFIFTTKGDFSMGIDPLNLEHSIIGKAIRVKDQRIDGKFWIFLNRVLAFFSFMQWLIYKSTTKNVFYQKAYLKVDTRLRETLAFIFRLLSNPILILWWVASFPLRIKRQ